MQQVNKQTLWAIWGALLASQFIYMGLSNFKLYSVAREGGNESMLITFCVGALVFGLISQHFFKRSKTAKDKFINIIVSWAIGESIAVLGLILPLAAGRDYIIYGNVFFVISIILHILRRPMINNNL